MSTPTTAWLRRVSLACACGIAPTALGQAPQQFSPPPNPVPINAPAAPGPVGHGSVAFRTTSQAPAPNVAPSAPPSAQQAYYQAAPGQMHQGVQPTSFAQQAALVQRYDQFVRQLPPGQSAARPAPPAVSPYPLERAGQIVPVSLQDEPGPAPTDAGQPLDAGANDAGMVAPGELDDALSHGSARNQAVGHADSAACNDCGKHCNSCNCNRGSGGFFWIRGEYLLWWTKGSPLPPLVTASPDTTPIAQSGVLGQPGTTILFGDNEVNDDSRSGFRFTGGYWFDCCMCAGLEADYFKLDSETTSFDAFCPPGQALARPFFNVVNGQQDAELVCYPGVVSGSVHVNTDSDFQGGGIRYLRNICTRNWCIPGNCGEPGIPGGYRLNWLAGYRYLQLDEGLTINEMLVSTNTGGVIPLGTEFDVTDDFQTDSEFHGIDLGLAAQWRRGRWTLDALGKAAFGNTTNQVSINGSTTTSIPNGPTNTGVGGLLAQSTNIGSYSEDEFSVVPEVGVNVGYYVTPRLRVLAGYTFIYWTNVVRPGDQIDLGLNPTQFPPGTLNGAARPAFTFNESDFWAQGLNFGAEYRF